MKQDTVIPRELDGRDQLFIDVGSEGVMPSDEALGALLEDGSPAADAEGRVRRLGERLARLDALNVAGMLAAASEGGGAGARLGARLDAGVEAGAALSARLRRCEAVVRAAPDAAHARFGAAQTDANARSLLAELEDLYNWLDAPPLRDLDSISEISLATPEGRASALAAGQALRAALRAEKTAPAARRRLGAVRERLRRLARAKEALAAVLTRHLNNALIHLSNEAAAHEPKPRNHHNELLPYAPFMRWLKDMDERAFDALAKVYTSTWSKVYQRAVDNSSEQARTALATAPSERQDPILDGVLTLVESLCDAEQDFCTQFFYLDIDVKSDGSDGDRSERSGDGERERRAGAESRRFMSDMFPALEQQLRALVGHVERHDKYGPMRALACFSRRVVPGTAGTSGTSTDAGEARWARAALAGGAVAAKRQADRAVADRLAALPDAVKQAAKRPKCGLLSFLKDFEELSGACEAIFAGGRRADLDRWYVSLASAMLHAIQHADHPRTPRAVLHMENYHRLHGILSLLRAAALEALRREARARYSAALKAYVTQYFGRPLEKLTQFFEGVAEAVAGGVREDEVCYRAAFSKHELKRLLAMYPAPEVRKSLHRLYRMVEKHLSEEGGLLQVVWRAMQEEFLAQHLALQSRIATCYPGAGLAMPLTTQDILDAFSDIAREH